MPERLSGRCNCRNQGLFPNERKTKRLRPFPPSHHEADQGFFEAVAVGICRSLSNSSLGLQYTHRRNYASLQRCCSSWLCALHWGFKHVCVAVPQGTLHKRTLRLGEVFYYSEPLQPPVPRGRTRDDTTLQGTGHRIDPVEPSRTRFSHRKI